MRLIVKIKKPYRKEKNNLPEYVELWAIEARELNESVPNNEFPILWRLLTTHPISNEQDALIYTQWYSISATPKTFEADSFS